MKIIVRQLGLQPYLSVWEEMKTVSLERDQTSPDEIWLVTHPPVFTQGQAGKPEHILKSTSIPIVQTDRGGQVTYHGPGQLIAYTLINLKERALSVRGLVTLIEESVMALLRSYDIHPHTQCKAPGVYVNDAKICSLGLRIKRGFSYHGLALNVNMDLSPFKAINPCGIERLTMTNMSEHVSTISMPEIETKLIHELCLRLGYAHSDIEYKTK